MKDGRNDRNLAGICILAAGSLWGTTGIFSHYFDYYGMDSMMKGLFRVSAAAIAMMVVMMLRGKKSFVMTKRGYGIALIQGLLTQSLFSWCYFTAIERLGMASSVVLLYTSPVFAAIISRIIYKEKITRKKMAAMAITVAGCAMTATGGHFHFAGSGAMGYGILMGVMAGFCYSTLSITSTYGTRYDDPMALTFYTFVFGVAGLFFMARPWEKTFAGPDWKLVVIALLSGIVSAAIPYFAYGYGSRYLKNPSLGPVYSSVENVAAALYGLILFHEGLNGVKVLGICLIILSIVIINYSPVEPGRVK